MKRKRRLTKEGALKEVSHMEDKMFEEENFSRQCGRSARGSRKNGQEQEMPHGILQEEDLSVYDLLQHDLGIETNDYVQQGKESYIVDVIDRITYELSINNIILQDCEAWEKYGEIRRSLFDFIWKMDPDVAWDLIMCMTVEGDGLKSKKKRNRIKIDNVAEECKDELGDEYMMWKTCGFVGKLLGSIVLKKLDLFVTETNPQW